MNQTIKLTLGIFYDINAIIPKGIKISRFLQGVIQCQSHPFRMTLEVLFVEAIQWVKTNCNNQKLRQKQRKSKQNFWDEAWWFLLSRVFGQLSSSLLLFPAFLRCLSNSETYTELWTMSFIESTGVACSDSVSHNQVQVLSIPVLLHIGRNIVEITIKMKTIVWKALMIKETMKSRK